MNIGDLYKHTKSGAVYKIIGIVAHSENCEAYVVYEPQSYTIEGREVVPHQTCWVRPQKMFEEYIEVNTERVPSFEKIVYNN